VEAAVVLKNNIPEIAERLDRLLWAVESKYPEKMKNALEVARSRVQRRTPMDTGRMASGWRLRVMGGSKKGRVAVAGWIENHYAGRGRFRYKSRAFKARFTRLSTGRINTRSTRVKTDGRVVLRSLEYGARPHTIRAAHVTKKGKPGFLAFRVMGTGSARAGSQTDETIFVREVEHPGNIAYGMIRRTRADLLRDAKRVNRDTRRTLQRIWTGKR